MALNELWVKFENDRDLDKAKSEMECIRRDLERLCETAALAIRNL